MKSSALRSVTLVPALLVCFALLGAGPAAGQIKTSPSVPVTSTVDDNDSQNPGACLLPNETSTQPNQCLFESDGAGPYTNQGIMSEIYQGTYWLLDLSGQTSRTVYVTFSNGWQAATGEPATPPLSDGFYPASASDSTRVISRCYSSSSGSSIVNFFSVTTSDPYCSLRIDIIHNGAEYLFVMAPIYPGTGFVTVVCNLVSSSGCVSSTIMPTPSQLGPNPNLAYLYSVNSRNGKLTLLGSALNSFLIQVTNP